MRYYIDTEFNGTDGQLLSLALVRQDGAHFYEVLHAHELIVPWVREHVVPHFDQEPVARLQAVKKMQKFLRKDDGPHVFIADWPEDLVHFNRMLPRDQGKRNDPFRYRWRECRAAQCARRCARAGGLCRRQSLRRAGRHGGSRPGPASQHLR